MNKRYLCEQHIQQFSDHLRQDEKSAATIEKYLRDVRAFMLFAGAESLSRDLVIAYKHHLQANGYAVRSINSMLASINSFLRFLGWNDCKVKNIRQQRQVYCPEEKELTKEDYLRLLRAAEARPQIHLLLETICGTGIRVSELRYFTVEAVRRGEVTIHCKSKARTILLPGKLKEKLIKFAKKNKLQTGSIFLSKKGKPLDRSWIWAQMKGLCKKAGVLASKVFPHNLRKLFARSFYSVKQDIAKLADILGHSSIDTTRIYIMTTGLEHRKTIERLGLVV